MARAHGLLPTIGLLAAVAGCGGGAGTGSPVDAAAGDAAVGVADSAVADATPSTADAAPGSEGGAPGDASPEAGGTLERGLRLAHFAFRIDPMDFCVGPNAKDAVFAGPLLKSAGQAAGLPYGRVSAYQPVPLGLLKLRIVAAGANDCNTPLFEFGSNVPSLTLNGNNFFTMVIESNGAGNPVPIREALTQDPAGDAPRGNIVLAFKNVMHMRLDFGPLVAGAFMAAFRNVDEFAQMSMSDQTAATLEVRMTGGKTAFLSAPNITLPGQTTWTAFVFGLIDSVATPPTLLFCPNAPAGGGLLDCSGH